MTSLSENFEHDTPLNATCNSSSPALGALPCDAFHHYYHYQSSSQYCWLARACFMLGQKEEAQAALRKALFQDHFNEEAIAMLENDSANGIKETYGKHPALDAEFRACIGMEFDAVTALHDSGIILLNANQLQQAALLFETAQALSPLHSNSRFGLGMVAFRQQNFAQAKEHFMEAVRLSHLAHDEYHRNASQEHMQRAKTFRELGEDELAINDLTKALNLYRGNLEAAEQRARLQALTHKRNLPPS